MTQLMKQTIIRAGVLALVAAALAGCKDATLGPSGSGALQGIILDAETEEPIAGASITTTPPTDAIVTDSVGRFAFEELETGNYQITARKAGYQQTTATVAVRANRTAQATVMLQKENPNANRVALEVEVLSFWNTARGDTTFAEAEYRVRNVGDVTINNYDVNFRIVTTLGERFLQERGQTLRTSQADVRRFQLNIQDATATAVEIESTWTDPPLRP